MPTRKCDACGKVRPVGGGAVCMKGHFICHPCMGGLLGGPIGRRTRCPICGTPLH